MIPLHTLLEDKTFDKFFRTTPHLYPIQVEPDRLTWRVWIKSSDTTSWRKRDVTNYQVGVRTILDRLEDLHDAALQCRGRSYGPPDRRIRLMSGGKPLLHADGSPQIKRTVWRLPVDLARQYGHHDWCFQCRRPTVFTYFINHHAFRGTLLESLASNDVRRCTLCGMAHSFNRNPR